MATKKKSTAVTNWKDELKGAAQEYADQESHIGGGSFFGLQSGVLTYDGSPVPGNQMAVVIVDSVLENLYYEGTWDSDNPEPPTCFAFGRAPDEMEIHEVVFKAEQNQSTKEESCAGCEHNEWGSADVGRGKACRNTRRLALIPAGTLNPKTDEYEPIEEEKHYQSSEFTYMKLPVTSTTAFANYVKSVSKAMGYPPFAVVTKISVVPDAKTQFKVVFETIGELEEDLLPIMVERNKECRETIDFPYSLERDDDDDKPAKASKKKAAKKPAKKASKKRKF